MDFLGVLIHLASSATVPKTLARDMTMPKEDHVLTSSRVVCSQRFYLAEGAHATIAMVGLSAVCFGCSSGNDQTGMSGVSVAPTSESPNAPVIDPTDTGLSTDDQPSPEMTVSGEPEMSSPPPSSSPPVSAEPSETNQCVLPKSSKVVFGTELPTHVPLDDDQIAAIGMIQLSSEGAICSGTLVSREWFITAAHCVVGEEPERLEVQFGRDNSNPDIHVGVAEFHMNPEWEGSPEGDTAFIRLASSPLEQDPEIMPIPLGLDSPQGSVGEKMEAAGYGLTENNTLGTRLFTAEPVLDVTRGHISVDGEGQRGLCAGDSGGPLMAIYPDGSVRVVGTLSGGDFSCLDVDWFARLDIQEEWIRSIIGEQDPCLGLTLQGRCAEQTASWCENDVPSSEDCMALGLVCGEDAAGNQRCVEDRSCGDVTAEGMCDGSIAIWCQEGELQMEDCSMVPGQLCGADPVSSGSRCVQDPCYGVNGGVNDL